MISGSGQGEFRKAWSVARKQAGVVNYFENFVVTLRFAINFVTLVSGVCDMRHYYCILVS